MVEAYLDAVTEPAASVLGATPILNLVRTAREVNALLADHRGRPRRPFGAIILQWPMSPSRSL
jgi:hypothetical protein